MSGKASTQSGQREALFEHLFLGQLMQFLWLRNCILEVSKPLVDNRGYDLILECNKVIRHVQLKVKKVAGTTPKWAVHCALSEKPSGCVIVLLVSEEEMAISSYLWFGGEPKARLPELGDKVTKHAKANADGIKAERPDKRDVGIGKFSEYCEISQIAEKLFGKIPESESKD